MLKSFSAGADGRGFRPVKSNDRSGKVARGFFYKARHFFLYKPIMIDSGPQQVIYNVPGSENLRTVFHILRNNTILEATVDSSARHPPPRCHPGTRQHLSDKLDSWLSDQQRQWNMVWLRGPAGTGKSAVAQSFAERAVRQGRFGAAFFFSRTNKRNNPLRVIPTLAYQLAEQHLAYKSLLTQQLAENSRVLDAALAVQFRKLIVEPFLTLVQGSQRPLLVILDGLDECNGEDPQREFIKLVCEAAHPENGLPFLWLICSRPEPHIIITFSTIESSINCCREQLVLDDESRNDVDRYLRDGFAEICDQYSDVIGTGTGQSWPSDNEFAKISNAASGLFIFAATVLKYITDPEYADPCYQLRLLLSFIDKSQCLGAKSPWVALDLLYTCILSEVPKHILPITLQLLGFCTVYSDLVELRYFPFTHAQVLSNFLCLDQGTFYTSLRKLHAVMDVPPPEHAAETELRFYHASFKDYLQDSTRSGRYFINAQTVYFELATRSLYWCALRPDADGPRDRNRFATHFRWLSPSYAWHTHLQVAKMAAGSLEKACALAEGMGYPDLFSQLRQCHFTDFVAVAAADFIEGFANQLHKLVSQGSGEDLGGRIIRTEASNSEDARLLSHLSSLAGPTASPARFPLKFAPIRKGEVRYFFLGDLSRSCIVCFGNCDADWWCRILRAEEQPSEEEIAEFRWYMGLARTR